MRLKFGSLWLEDYQLKYFKADPRRLNALEEFSRFNQEIIDKGLKTYDPQYGVIEIFGGSILSSGRRSLSDSNPPFNLDLHGFKKIEVTIVLEKFLSLIEKHNIPFFNIIHGKSGNVMFDTSMDCLEKIRHKLEDFNLTKQKESRKLFANGFTTIRSKTGNPLKWPLCKQYDYDEEFRAKADLSRKEWNEKRATSEETTSSSTTTKSSSECFVATAVYGDPHCDQIVLLRRFRDEVLSKNRFGKYLCTIYYKHGKLAAVMIQDKPTVKRGVRFAIEIIVKLICR